MQALLETLLQVGVALLCASAAVILLALSYIAACKAIDWDHARLQKRFEDVAFRRNKRIADELRAKEKQAKEVAVKDQTRKGPEVVVRSGR